MFHGHWACFPKPPLGGGPNTKPGGHGTPNAHNRWFIVFYHVWGIHMNRIHWNNIWSRACSHMTLHYIWVSVTTLHDFGGVLGRPLDTFFWAITISWSRLLARVRSGPYSVNYTFTRQWKGDIKVATNWSCYSCVCVCERERERWAYHLVIQCNSPEIVWTFFLLILHYN